MESVAKNTVKGIAVGVIALVMCAVTVVIVQQTAVVPQPSLADRLPADKTVAFVKLHSMEEWAAVEHALGLEGRLGTPLPAIGSGSYELAVLDAGGSWQWVLQTSSRNDHTIEGPAAGMLVTGEDRSGVLTRAASFRRMSRQSAPAAWARTAVLPLAENRPDTLLRAMLAPYSHVQLAWNPTTVTLLRTERASLPSRPAGPAGVAADGMFDIVDPALSLRLEAVMAAMDRDAPQLREGVSGIIAQRLREEVGTEAAGHVAAMAKNLSGIRVARASKGDGSEVQVALSFQGADPKTVAALLDAYAANVPQSSVRDVDLPKNQRTDITVDEEAVERGEETMEGWTLQWVRSRSDDRILAAARHGQRTIVSTDIGIVRGMIQETAAPQGGAAASPQAGGGSHADVTEEFAAGTLPVFAKESASLLWKALGTDVRWTLSAQPDADVITVSQE